MFDSKNADISTPIEVEMLPDYSETKFWQSMCICMFHRSALTTEPILKSELRDWH